MSLNTALLIPLLSKLADYLKVGINHYADLRAAGAVVNADILAAFLCAKMSDWNPKVAGKSALDDETKAAGARLLAGLIINLSS